MELKSLFLPKNRKNHEAAGGSAPSVTRLSCNVWFSTVPKLEDFCAKKLITLGLSPSLFAKPWLRFWSHSLLQRVFLPGLCVFFFKDEYTIVALKYQFLCAKVQSIFILPPIFG